MQFFNYTKTCCLVVTTYFLVPLIYAEDHQTRAKGYWVQAKEYRLTKAKVNYIKKKYEHTIYKKKCLFYPAKNPKRLLISFCGAVRGIYSKFSWFWRNDENWQDTAYLFVRDDQLTWYLGNNKKDMVQDFANLIRYFMAKCKLKPEQVFVVGGSMGGYGALLYATLLGLRGALLLNPQVNRTCNYANRFAIARSEGRWKDLDAIVAASAYVPSVSLIYGHYAQDQAAGEALVKVLKTKAPLTIIHRHPSPHHGIDTVFSKKFIEREIEYIEQQTVDLQGADAELCMEPCVPAAEMMLCGKTCLFYPAAPIANRLLVFFGKTDDVLAHFPWISRKGRENSDSAYLVINADKSVKGSVQSYVEAIAQIMRNCNIIADNVCIVGVGECVPVAFFSAVLLKAKSAVVVDNLIASASSEWSDQAIQLISPHCYTPQTILLSEGRLYSPFGSTLIDVLRHKPSLTILRHCNGGCVMAKRFFENECAYMGKQIPFARDFGGMEPDEELFDDDIARFKQGVSFD